MALKGDTNVNVAVLETNFDNLKDLLQSIQKENKEAHKMMKVENKERRDSQDKILNQILDQARVSNTRTTKLELWKGEMEEKEERELARRKWIVGTIITLILAVFPAVWGMYQLFIKETVQEQITVYMNQTFPQP